MAETIWMNRNDLTDLRINEELLPDLGDGGVRLRIESFAVTANNVTYAAIGDAFGYWNFFPAQDGYGVVPMWGHAVVEMSNHADFAIGERVYGYLPMGSHLDVWPDKITPHGFFDSAPHRQPMSPIYNQYSRLAADPEHDPAHENERMLFAPLFKTGFLIEHFFNSEGWFGAGNLVMTSASSKTSMGLAACARRSSPQVKRIGLTSAGNVAFTQDTGLYDEVIAYDAIAALPSAPAVVVDFAGNAEMLCQIHAQLNADLKYSCLVGATHVDARGGGIADISGPKPILFFAPDHAVAAVKQMGPKAFGAEVTDSWKEFLGTAIGALKIDQRDGLAAAGQAFLSILKNEADPSKGIIIRP